MLNKKFQSYDSRRTYIVKILLTLFFAFVVVCPLVRMLCYLFQTDIKSVIFNEQFKTALLNSFVSTVVSSVISVGLAIILSYCIYRTQIKHKTIFSVLLTLPMLIPSVSHGMGLILLFGSNGFITNLFKLDTSVYGFWGLVTGSVMYSFPVAFLMLSDILKYQDYLPYEACKVMGIRGFDRFKAVTFPYLRKPLISVFFATFTMIITDYGVPLMVGGKYTTLPVLMYQQVVGLLDFGKGTVIGTILLLPAVIAFILDTVNKDKASSSFTIKPFPSVVSKSKLIFTYIFVCTIVLFILLPILSFIILSVVTKYPVNMSLTFKHILKTINIGGLKYLGNSSIIALFTSVIGTIVAFGTAYFAARQKDKASRFLHMVAITTLAIPGIVLGLSYMLFFKGSILYGTFAILILVNTMHFFSSPYLMAYNSFEKINSNLEAVGQTMGIGKFQLVKDVFIPQMFGTILEMFSYFFVNSMMTISAVSFLANAQNKPLSLMINLFQAQMIMEGAAFVSLAILTINILMKLIVYILKRRYLNVAAKRI